MFRLKQVTAFVKCWERSNQQARGHLLPGSSSSLLPLPQVLQNLGKDHYSPQSLEQVGTRIAKALEKVCVKEKMRSLGLLLVTGVMVNPVSNHLSEILLKEHISTWTRDLCLFSICNALTGILLQYILCLYHQMSSVSLCWNLILSNVPVFPCSEQHCWLLIY